MSIKSNPQTISVHVDPLTINAGIKILGGSAVQTYHREVQEFVPSRTIVPLVISPEINVSDPHNMQDGVQTLTGVEWFEGAPKGDNSNRIAAGTFYEIGDGKVAGFPKYALKCKKNVDVNSPLEIYCIASFTDRRKNIEVKVERCIKLYTAYYDGQVFSLKISKPSGWTIDPLQQVPAQGGEWFHKISAQLYSGERPVRDANAVYWWEIKNEVTKLWEPVSADDEKVWIDSKDPQGNFKKELTFDARMVDKTASFRCRAAFFEKAKPSAPTSEELQATTTVDIAMPHSLTVDIQQLKGAKIEPSLSTPVAYECVLSYNKGIIPEGKFGLFDIHWFVQSGAPGAQPKEIGNGKKIEFIPKSLGLDPKYSITTYVEVKLFTCYKPVAAADGSIITQNDAVVIQAIYE